MLVTEFAFSQKLFQSLRVEDQKKLLSKNIPLYLQYVLARYFCSETGIEQLSWLLEGHIPIQTIEEINSLRCLDFNELNHTMELFGAEKYAEHYYNSAKEVSLAYFYNGFQC
jgi:hypothetical protein